MLYLWLIFSILYFIIALFNISLHKFSAFEIAIGALVTYSVAATVMATIGNLEAIHIYIDMIGNFAILCCLSLIVYVKTKDVLQSILIFFVCCTHSDDCKYVGCHADYDCIRYHLCLYAR